MEYMKTACQELQQYGVQAQTEELYCPNGDVL